MHSSLSKRTFYGLLDVGLVVSCNVIASITSQSPRQKQSAVGNGFAEQKIQPEKNELRNSLFLQDVPQGLCGSADWCARDYIHFKFITHNTSYR